ncbi:hypothetical protein GCM10028808_25190 [Spirosoma migulaei]
MQVDKLTASVGEEVTLTITAHYLNISSALLFTAAGSTAFQLKVLLPDGFVQTGGDYTDYIGTELSGTKPTATYTLKGHFDKFGSKSEFRLLRSHALADANSLFVEKARLSIRLNATDLSTQQLQKSARLAAVSNGVGFIDGADCNTAGGWAADRAQLNTPISVDFYIDGQYAGSIQAGQSRPDVGAYLGDNGNHGFAFTIPQQFKSGGNHTIEARFGGTSQGLNSGAKTFSCSGTTTTSPPTGNCNYSEGQFLFTTSWGESVYAHYYNNVLFAAFQDGSNFRPRHWLVATGLMTTAIASCFAENDPHTTTTTPTNPPTSGGTGTGLSGKYFNNLTLSGSPVLSRTDATVNFTWNEGNSPFPGVSSTNMSVRWSGQVEAPVTGSYTFSTNNDDATQLWVNGQKLISDWPGGHAPVLRTGTINLQAGQKYSIKLEFNQGGGGAQAQLLWSYPNQGQQVIPQARLYPDVTVTSGPGSVGGDTANPTNGTCSVNSPRANIDIINAQSVAGWALDASDLGKTVMVDIYINDTKVASVPADQDRSDLVSAFGNNVAARYHGFNIDLFYLQDAPQGYRLTVKICGTNNILREEQVYFSQRTATVDGGDDPTKPKPPCTPVILFRQSGKREVVYACNAGGSTGSPNGPIIVIDYNPGPVTVGNEPPTSTPITGGSGNPTDPNNPTITGSRVPTTAHLDGVDCDKVSGWAFANSGGYANLDVYIIDELGLVSKAATIKANNASRSDVRAAYGNNPNIPLDCGFVWAIPDAYKHNQKLTIKVVPVNDNASIANSPLTTSGSCSKPVTTTPSGTGYPLSWNDFPDLKGLSNQYFLDNYVLVGPKRPINIAERLNCFGTVPSDSKYQYSITMYVDQPVNNTREIAKFSVSPTERRPGHTYFGLERYDSNTRQTVRLVAGFYVETEWKAAMGMVTKGAWGDDGSTEYDVSLKVPLTASQFKEIKYKIEASGVPNYSLVQNNCSSFTYNLISPYINLPAGSGAIGILGVGINPADLGQDLRENSNTYNGKITIADNSISPPTTNCN